MQAKAVKCIHRLGARGRRPLFRSPRNTRARRPNGRQNTAERHVFLYPSRQEEGSYPMALSSSIGKRKCPGDAPAGQQPASPWRIPPSELRSLLAFKSSGSTFEGNKPMRCDHRCKERAVFARRRGALRRFMLAAAVCAAVHFGMTDSMAGDQPLQLFAAGSLKASLSDVAPAYEAMYDKPGDRTSVG